MLGHGRSGWGSAPTPEDSWQITLTAERRSDAADYNARCDDTKISADGSRGFSYAQVMVPYR